MTDVGADLYGPDMRHHPWRGFRALSHYTLKWAHLPLGTWAVTDLVKREVTMTHGLDQAERRGSIEHERQHILDPNASEAAIRERTARTLIPFDQLADAMVWSFDEIEIADQLWVDVHVVRDRMATLTDQETVDLNRRLDAAELLNP